MRRLTDKCGVTYSVDDDTGASGNSIKKSKPLKQRSKHTETGHTDQADDLSRKISETQNSPRNLPASRSNIQEVTSKMAPDL